MNSDTKIETLISQIKQLQKSHKDITNETIREKYKDKFIDDEIDMALVLCNEKFSYGFLGDLYKSIPSYIFFSGLVLISFVLIVIGLGKFITVILFVAIGYITSVSNQRENYANKILLVDFNANHIVHFTCDTSLIPSDAIYYDVIECIYDKKKTIYGKCEWTRGSRKNKTTYNRTFVQQYIIGKKYEKLVLYPDIHIPLFNFMKGEDVKMDSEEFNKNFLIKTEKNPEIAFNILTPRLMDMILKEYNNEATIEFYQDRVMIVYNDFVPGIFFRLSGPIVRFDEYIQIKQYIMKKFNTISNITDVVLREKIEDPKDRSNASME